MLAVGTGLAHGVAPGERDCRRGDSGIRPFGKQPSISDGAVRIYSSGFAGADLFSGPSPGPIPLLVPQLRTRTKLSVSVTVCACWPHIEPPSPGSGRYSFRGFWLIPRAVWRPNYRWHIWKLESWVVPAPR